VENTQLRGQMKLNFNCLPCLVNQVVRVANMTQADNKELLFKKVFTRLGELDFTESNSEIVGITFDILREHLGNDDPYMQTRAYYNKLFLDMMDSFAHRIECASNPFEQSVKFAIIGNIIDFNPIHNKSLDDIMKFFESSEDSALTINHISKMNLDIANSKTLLYLGDNCGEICLDKLLIRQIKACNPDIDIFFGVRGKPVVNDAIETDAYFVGMDEYAKIINNGDDSLGTVIHRISPEFKKVYNEADIIISKGQANYESLSEEYHKNIYFLLVAKCDIIAKDIGVPLQSLICMNNRSNPTREAL